MTQKLIATIKNTAPVALFIIGANLLNFIFNAYLAHNVSLATFGFITLLNTFWTLLLVGAGSIVQVTGFQIANAEGSDELTLARFKVILDRTTNFAIYGSLLWFTISPLINNFFTTPHIIGIASFAPMILFGLLAGVYRGALQGKLLFTIVGILYFVETLSKLLLAIAFNETGNQDLIYLSLPVSVLIAFISSKFVAAKYLNLSLKNSKTTKETFPTSLMISSLINGLASMAFLSVDLLLANHYLTEDDAGNYAILSLSGKLIFFLGTILNSFFLSILGKKNQNARKAYAKFYLISVSLSLAGYIFFGLFGGVTTPIIFGSNSSNITQHLQAYGLGTALFTISATTITYYISKNKYIFPLISLFSSLFMSLLILFYNSTIGEIVFATLLSGIICFALVTLLDLVNLFSEKRKTPKEIKRVLVLNWRDTKHNQAGGAEEYIHQIAKRWVTEHSLEVTFFAGNDGHSKKFEVIDGINIYRKGSFYITYFWAFLFYILKFRGKHDIIIDCQNGIPFFTPLYSRKPVICVVHHVHQQVFERFLNKPMAAIAKFLEKTLMPLVYRRSQYVAVSDSTKEEMIHTLGINSKQISIIHNGVDLNKLYPSDNKTKEPTILYLGRLKQYKSVDVLIRAFALTLKDNSKSKLVIAGSGDDEERLKDLVKELKLVNHVRFAGRVSEKEKLRLLQSSWVAVNPSLMEGWGISNIEANACKTPILASNVPGLKDSVKDGYSGKLFDYGNTKELSLLLNQIITNTSERKQLSKNAVKWASNFTWDSSAEKYIKKFKQYYN